MMPKISYSTSGGSGNSGLAVFPGPSSLGRDLLVDTYHNTAIEHTLFNVSTDLHLRVLPNLVKDATSISYSIKQPSSIVLAVYNTNGEVVANIDQGIKSAGQHRLRWNAKSLSSGVYFITLKSNGTQVDWQKVVLMK